MKTLRLLVTSLGLLLLAGCELAAGIFEAGVWVGVIAVLLILALVGWAVSRMRR